MTSKLKCPFCETELEQMHDKKLLGCPKCLHIADGAFWAKAIQAKQDLEIARKALEEMQHWLGVVRCSMISHLNNQNNTLLEHYETDSTVQNIDKAKRILKHYIEQIEHKE